MLIKHSKTTIAIKGITCVCALIFGLALAYGGSTGEVIKATPEQFDFGTIPEGDPAVTTAIIENVGDVTVEITNVRTT